MKKILLLLIFFIIISCSNDSNENYSDCINSAKLNNEFMYQCKTYKTEAGRMNINYTTQFQTTSCMLELVNSEYSDFIFKEGDKNINAVNIWLSIPSSYYSLKKLPEGTYLHRENNDDPSTLDIVTLFSVAKNASLYSPNGNSSLFYSDLIISQPENFEAAEVTIDKLPSGEYEINYYFDAKGKIIKGHFKGFLSFTSSWN
ncbi:hypothetical protein [Flavobacterium undicola]|uniref:hypothetical protein n=1 Tax=Flavobacterium undicola TaxID=1932779 RepID=UPI001379102F|nr:hypothetical protein [Flavobacterium undicola]MBA0882752.1 hypothetical protein [Flavobacterium undicola]